MSLDRLFRSLGQKRKSLSGTPRQTLLGGLSHSSGLDGTTSDHHTTTTPYRQCRTYSFCTQGPLSRGQPRVANLAWETFSKAGRSSPIPLPRFFPRHSPDGNRFAGSPFPVPPLVESDRVVSRKLEHPFDIWIITCMAIGVTYKAWISNSVVGP